MIEAHDLPMIFNAFRDRHRERDFRMRQMDSVVRGDWTEVDPANDRLISRSPNLIQVALEDTAEAAGTMPTLRVIPRKATQTLKKKSAAMEKIGMGYMDNSSMELKIMETVMDMAAFGLAAWVVWPNFDTGLPEIERRDPRHCYPEPGYRPNQSVRRVLFTRQLHFSELPVDYQHKILDFVTDDQGNYVAERLKMTMMEFFTEEEIIVAALFQGNETDTISNPGYGIAPGPVYTPVILDRWENKTGVCPVVLGSRFTLDGESRGQFDQIVGIMEAHVRLMAMVLDYADQAVYSDIWVKDLIGELSWGGGAYIELGPQGAIGRVPPAVTSLNIGQDLDRLVEGIYLGGRYPKSRPGEIDQAIASAKFVEATAGVMNTAIKTYHQILQQMIERAMRLCFKTDMTYFPFEKQVNGILKNQEYVESYNPTVSVDLNNRIRCEYGLGLGRDPAQSAVLMIQYAQNKYISNEFVQENIDGLTDVERERRRIDSEDMVAMMKAKLLQGVQDGSIPGSALVSIMEEREAGESLAALFKKYIPDAPPAAPEGGAPPGPPGPGAPPTPAGPGGPITPPEGGAPIGPPPAPPPGQIMSRLGVPMTQEGPGARSFMSMQSGR